jgi:hypothetical protein
LPAGGEPTIPVKIQVHLFNIFKKHLVDDTPSLPKGFDFYLKDVPGAIERIDHIPRIHWSKVFEAMEHFSAIPDQDVIWTELAAQWLGLLRLNFGEPYEIYEGKHLLLLSDKGEGQARRLSEAVDVANERIQKEVGFPAEHRQWGKHPILLLSSQKLEKYIRYFEPLTEDNVLIGPGCRYIARGYHHTLICGEETEIPRMAVWGLSICLVSSRPLPRWLAAGFVACVPSMVVPHSRQTEYSFGDAPAGILARQAQETQRRLWSSSGVDGFWDGSAFATLTVPDLSCQLAAILFHNLATDPVRSRHLRQFLATADTADGGSSAYEQCFGRPISTLVEEYLGPGSWQPKNG